MRYVASWRLSKVGLGTSQFANPGWGYGADHKPPYELVRRALDLGINHFDTSSFYGAGHSERILGDILGNVEDMTATKLFNVAPSARLVMAQARASIEHLGGHRPCAT